RGGQAALVVVAAEQHAGGDGRDQGEPDAAGDQRGQVRLLPGWLRLGLVAAGDRGVAGGRLSVGLTAGPGPAGSGGDWGGRAGLLRIALRPAGAAGRGRVRVGRRLRPALLPSATGVPTAGGLRLGRLPRPLVPPGALGLVSVIAVVAHPYR